MDGRSKPDVFKDLKLNYFEKKDQDIENVIPSENFTILEFVVCISFIVID